MPNIKNIQFLQDIDQIFASDIFIQEYIKQNKNKDRFFELKNCITEATNYVNSFGNIRGGQELCGLLNQLTDLERHTSLAIARDYIDFSLETDLTSDFQTMLHVLPSFQEQIANFVSEARKKGASLGDDGMRILNSLSHIMDNLASRYEMQVGLETLASWKEEKQKLDNSYERIQKSVQSFSKDCVDNNVYGTALDLYEENLEDDITKLKEDLENLKSKEVREQHTKEFNECSKRIIDNKDKFQELSEQETELNRKLYDAKTFLYFYNTESGNFEEKRQFLKDYPKKEADLNQQIEAADDKLEEYKKELAQYEPAIDFLNNISPEDKQKLDEMGDMQREVATCTYSIRNIDSINSNPDIVTNRYETIKKTFLEGAPFLKSRFDEYEKDPSKESPDNFEKSLYDEIRDRINTNTERIESYQNTPFYKKYQEALQQAGKWQAKKYSIDTMQSHKDQLQSDLAQLKDEREEAIYTLESWKPRAKEVMGEYYVENEVSRPSFIRGIFRSILSELEGKKKQLVSEAWDLGKEIAKDSKRLAELKEGLSPVKITATEQKISQLKSKRFMVHGLQSDKEKLNKQASSLCKDVVDVRFNMNKALNKQYAVLGEHLSNIVEHFDDVQSFWVKGKSPTCEQMYRSIESLAAKLKTPGSREEMIKAFKETRQLAQNYLDEKNAQNRSKMFATEQRYWRLSMAEQTIGLLDNAEKMFTKLKMVPGIDKVEEFVKASSEIKVEDSAKRLDANIDKTSKEIKEQNQVKKETGKENSKEQVFEDINKPYVM